MAFLSSKHSFFNATANFPSDIDFLYSQFDLADSVDIAVGYASTDALEELRNIVEEKGISHICVLLGMYVSEGIQENIYNKVLDINEEWQEKGLGEIRFTTFRYHGKLYAFSRNGKMFRGYIGSANLSVLKDNTGSMRQMEVGMSVDEQDDLENMERHFAELMDRTRSTNAAQIGNLRIIRQRNMALQNIQMVEAIPRTEVDIYRSCLMQDCSFELPIKVPGRSERFLDDNRHFTKSNINVCYAAPRSARKARDWYETQFTVSKEIRSRPGYPQKNTPFKVVTDDGYIFLAHTTSDSNKQFSAVGNELIMGRWLKGRLAAAGLVAPVNNVGEDAGRNGMITREMLERYGADTVRLTKTTRQAVDDKGRQLDVWFLSFEQKT